MHRIMLVDDEPGILNAIVRIMRQETAWEVEIFSDVNEALRRAQIANFELFLSDYHMPVMNGVEFLTEVKKIQPEAMRIILSGVTDLDASLGAINEAEIFRFICKPWDDYNLLTSIRQALAYREILVENRRLANQVREQKDKLDNHKAILDSIHEQHPGLLNVDWAEDGSVILEELK